MSTKSWKVLYTNNSYGTEREKENRVFLQSKQDLAHVMPGMLPSQLTTSRSCRHPAILIPLAGDVLEWITWGGGGLGDPLTRSPSIVAAEVHRKLVSVSGAEHNYGVVVDPQDFSVNEAGTAELRQKMREERKADADWKEDVAYNRGVGMEELMRSCEEETGLKAPRPQWEKRPYGPHVGLDYVKKWYERMGNVGYKGWSL